MTEWKGKKRRDLNKNKERKLIKYKKEEME